MNDAGIALFIRFPEPGRVKTRLAAALGDAAASQLYAAFVLDLLDSLSQVPARLLIFYDPGTEIEDLEHKLSQWLGAGLEFLPQSGDDLGARMENAFAHCFDLGLTRVALMGSDVPDFPAPLVAGALDELRRSDAVIGPATDGGYYLIGFTRETFLPRVFHDMPWGQDNVFKNTIEQLKAARLTALRLPDWIDVDTVRDLNALWRLNRNSSFNQSRTYKLLAQHQETLERYDREPAEGLDAQGRPQEDA